MMTEYVWKIDRFTPGNGGEPVDLDAFAERAETWLAAHLSENTAVTVRPVFDGEAAGVYRMKGASIECPEHVDHAINGAWEHACETE